MRLKSANAMLNQELCLCNMFLWPIIGNYKEQQQQQQPIGHKICQI